MGANPLSSGVYNGVLFVSNEPVNPSSKGWGFALAIIALAIVANLTAYKIHKATYLAPDRAPAGAEAKH